MKVLVQWTTAQLSDWEEIDSSSWADTPYRSNPIGAPASAGVDNRKGWINKINIQGIEFSTDHYAVEDIDRGGIRAYGWNDDPKHTSGAEQYAYVWDIYPLSADAGHGGAINTEQHRTMYWGSGIAERLGRDFGESDKPWSEFPTPSEVITRHGKELTDQVYQRLYSATTLRGWKEWAESGQNVTNQRARGLYSKPSGTKTWFIIDAFLGSSIHSGTADVTSMGFVSGIGLQLDSATGTSATVTSPTVQQAEYGIALAITTSATEPNVATWPTGTYRLQLDVTTAGGAFEYGVRDAGGVSGHFGRVNAGLTASVATVSSVSTLNTGTGIKLMTATWTPGGSTQTDRLEVVLAAGRPANHGNATMAYEVGDTDSFIDAPFTDPIAQLSSLSAVCGGIAMVLPYHGPFMYSGKAYALFTPTSDVSAINIIFGFSGGAFGNPGDRDLWSNTQHEGINLSGAAVDYDCIQQASVIHIVTVNSAAEVRYHQYHTSNDSWGISNSEITSAGSFAGGDAGGRYGVAITQRNDGDLLVLALGSGSSSVDRNWFYEATNPVTPAFVSQGQIYSLGTVGERHAVLTSPNADDTVLAFLIEDQATPDLLAVGIEGDNTINTAVTINDSLTTNNNIISRPKGELVRTSNVVMAYNTTLRNIVELIEVSDVPSSLTSGATPFNGVGIVGGTATLSNHTVFAARIDGAGNEAVDYAIAGTLPAPWDFAVEPEIGWEQTGITAGTTQNRWTTAILDLTSGTTLTSYATGMGRNAVHFANEAAFTNLDLYTRDTAIDITAFGVTITEAQFLTIAPTLDVGAVATATQPVEARWLVPTTHTVELGGAPGADIAQFNSLSAMAIAASDANMNHIYGGPYFYSGQIYILGIGVNSNEVMNVARTISASITTRDNWSATWDGVSLVDDIRAYDSIQVESVMQVVIQVSQSDTTYHEFHFSNNTWGISNQPIASGGVGGITSAARLGVAITRRADGDKIVGAIYTHTTSSIDQQMLYIQSATTAWTSNGPINPRHPAGQNARGIELTTVNSEDEALAYLDDTAQDVEVIHIAADSSLSSNFLQEGAAAANAPFTTYNKGINAAGNVNIAYFGGTPTPRWNQLDVSTSPTRQGSNTIMFGTGGRDANSGYYGGMVQTSETVTFVYQLNTNNPTFLTNFHGESSAGLWSTLADDIPNTGTNQHLFHNNLSVAGTSYGSGLEAFIVWNDNHSSIDVTAIGVDVAQTVDATPVEARWLVPAPSVANTTPAQTVDATPVEAQWQAPTHSILLGERKVDATPVEAQWQAPTHSTILGERKVDATPVEAQWQIPAPSVVNTSPGQVVSPAPVEAQWQAPTHSTILGERKVDATPVEAQWLVPVPSIVLGEVQPDRGDDEPSPAPIEAQWQAPTHSILLGERKVDASPVERCLAGRGSVAGPDTLHYFRRTQSRCHASRGSVADPSPKRC
jgi:hypothetical protein